MRVLLDTCALLWIDQTTEGRLGSQAMQLLAKSEVTVWVSVATIWEIAIKNKLGKLPLATPIDQFVEDSLSEGIFELLEIGVRDVLSVSRLPLHHRDPFDRLIAAQCLQGDFTLLSSDSIFDAYGVKRVWS